MNSNHKPDKEAIRKALEYPNGYVYKIDPGFSENDAIPTQAIVGAWKVDENGKIVGDFIPNPNYLNLKDLL